MKVASTVASILPHSSSKLGSSFPPWNVACRALLKFILLADPAEYPQIITLLESSSCD